MRTSIHTSAALLVLGVPMLALAQRGLVAPGPKVGIGCLDPRTPLNSVTTPGDADSRFRIAAPGSYYLTSSVVGQSGRSGIEIASSDVTIDLMGHRIEGVPGSLDGITYDGDVDNIVISGGTVTGFDGDGIDLRGQSTGVRIERVVATGNGGLGIGVGLSSSVLACTALGNGASGIRADQDCRVEDSHARENAAAGIAVGFGGIATNCIAHSNGTDGFSLSGSVGVDCRARDNDDSGFRLTTSAEVRKCSAQNNGASGFVGNGTDSTILECKAMSNGEYGIRLGSNGVVRGCKCSYNGAVGIGAGIRVEGNWNVIEDNVAAINPFTGYSITGSDNLLRANRATQNGVNWNVVGGNSGQIVDATQAFGVFGNAGGVAVGVADPHVNHTY